jgi:glycosyltransferase involved in cell wall biosynthesis
MIPVLARLKRQKFNAKLLIVYPGIYTETERAYFKKLCVFTKKFELQKDILFINNPEDIAAIYTISDIIISLSQEETFSLIALEAFISRKLFVYLKNGVYHNNISGKNSISVIQSLSPMHIAKQLELIFHTTEKIKKAIIDRNYTYASNFSWQKTAENLLTIMNKI